MILTLRPNENSRIILRWPKVPESDLPFLRGSSGNYAETKTNGQAVKLFRNVRVWLTKDRVKYVEMSRIILGFWLAQLVPFYQDREVGSNITKLGKNSKAADKNYLIITL